MEKIDLKGRYLKVVDDCDLKDIYHFKNGDYLEFKEMKDRFEWWGIYSDDQEKNKYDKKPYYFGIEAHKKNYFQLMPVGFTPFS